MNIIFSIVYFLFIVIIIANAVRIVKSFRGTNSMFENINNMVKERYDSVMQNNVFQENKVAKKEEVSADLDDFLKSNTNPVKEKRGKRSKI